ncbi:MAG: prolipoprotein diacylglyceryl transferase, partial [Bacteroidetes bacterium]|nr:prolipoprotein diacylglyceryl transferase [Bacteroidota bacterium]
MYATISDLLLDLFGLNIPLPIQTFGFFLGLSFFGAFWATQSELKRKETNGLINTTLKSIKINEPISPVDYITTTVISAFIGFKLFEMILDYDALVQNPQLFLLSAKGSWFGAIAGGAYGYYTKHKESEKVKGKTIEIKTEVHHPYQHMANILVIAGAVGILGAKIFHKLEILDEFSRDPWGSLISFSGLTFYGGLIMAAIAVLIYTTKNNIPPLHM